MNAKIKDWTAIILGNTINAFAVALFILPNGLAMGGSTGIALTVNHFFNVPLSLFVLIFNIAMFILGALLLGRKFAVTTAISTFYYPFMLEVFQKIIGSYSVTDDIFLNTFFAGLFMGASLGIVVRAGASTGGMDVPPLVLNKYFGVPVSVSMYAFGCLILVFQFLFRDTEKILYGVVLIMINALVLDKILVLGKQRVQLQVISEKSDEIKEAIMEKMVRGVTLMYGETGYMGEKCRIILTVVSNRQLLKTERLIKSIDPDSFVIVNSVKEVAGKGF
ncbi:MAG: YitT family protein [Candidatus Metalachnospira sp.]|nr:YitT family protein [Candidatus Metalachnospira sp.]